MLVLERGCSDEPQAGQDRAGPLFAGLRGHRGGRQPASLAAEDERHFYVGAPLDMEDVRVHLNLERLVERSSGVFGKSGTGKTFLTRTLLAGIIKQGVAVNLIFDMHNEYGWESQGEGGTRSRACGSSSPARSAS